MLRALIEIEHINLESRSGTSLSVNCASASASHTIQTSCVVVKCCFDRSKAPLFLRRIGRVEGSELRMKACLNENFRRLQVDVVLASVPSNKGLSVLERNMVGLAAEVGKKKGWCA